MAKGSNPQQRKKGASRRDGGGRRNHQSSDEEEDIEESHDHDETSKPDFATRREMQRKAAAEKRRSKQRCHLCGQLGHVRRECPGIDDDGRGESKYTKSKGDKGSATLAKKSTQKKGSRNRGKKQPKDNTEKDDAITFPAGFSVNTTDNGEDPFCYYDAGCDHAATMEYLRFGRGKHKLSTREAIQEYQSVMDAASSSSNYGGCITRSIVKQGWTAEEGTPFTKQESVWFVVGLDTSTSTTTASDNAMRLLETTLEDNRDCIVGVFCDLDYTPKALSECDRDLQLEKLQSMCQIASNAAIPIQIRTLPPASNEESESSSPYSQVMTDLVQVVSDMATILPSLKIHLSCWSGRAQHLVDVLAATTNTWIGMDGTVSFTKAAEAHECAFDVPLEKLLLETGGTTIPAKIANAKGRQAFCHSCLVPYVAEAIATQKKITAEEVARAASENTLMLYPQLERTADFDGEQE